MAKTETFYPRRFLDPVQAWNATGGNLSVRIKPHRLAATGTLYWMIQRCDRPNHAGGGDILCTDGKLHPEREIDFEQPFIFDVRGEEDEKHCPCRYPTATEAWEKTIGSPERRIRPFYFEEGQEPHWLIENRLGYVLCTIGGMRPPEKVDFRADMDDCFGRIDLLQGDGTVPAEVFRGPRGLQKFVDAKVFESDGEAVDWCRSMGAIGPILYARLKGAA